MSTNTNRKRKREDGGGSSNISSSSSSSSNSTGTASTATTTTRGWHCYLLTTSDFYPEEETKKFQQEYTYRSLSDTNHRKCTGVWSVLKRLKSGGGSSNGCGDIAEEEQDYYNLGLDSSSPLYLGAERFMSIFSEISKIYARKLGVSKAAPSSTATAQDCVWTKKAADRKKQRRNMLFGYSTDPFQELSEINERQRQQQQHKKPRHHSTSNSLFYFYQQQQSYLQKRQESARDDSVLTLMMQSRSLTGKHLLQTQSRRSSSGARAAAAVRQQQQQQQHEEQEKNKKKKDDEEDQKSVYRMAVIVSGFESDRNSAKVFCERWRGMQDLLQQESPEMDSVIGCSAGAASLVKDCARSAAATSSSSGTSLQIYADFDVIFNTEFSMYSIYCGDGVLSAQANC